MYTEQDLENYLKKERASLKQKVDRRIKNAQKATQFALEEYKDQSFFSIIEALVANQYYLVSYGSLNYGVAGRIKIEQFNPIKLTFDEVGFILIFGNPPIGNSEIIPNNNFRLGFNKKYFKDNPSSFIKGINTIEEEGDKYWYYEFIT